MAGAAYARAALALALAVAAATAATVEAQQTEWLRGHATFYGGPDASGTMGGACGYGNLFAQGYGTRTAALSTALFSGGAACGQCYKLVCDRKTDATWCRPGVSVTVTATNFCPPNSALPDGGWCNAVRAHFDMAQPAWEKIGSDARAGIIPVIYRRASCVRKGGVRFAVGGHDYFNLVLLTNVAGPGSVRAMDVKGEKPGPAADWMHMARNWGANWHSLTYLTGQGLSFRVTVTDGQTLVFADVVPPKWRFGQSFASKLQFKL